MKLVIDIPEEEYEEIISSEDCGLHTLTRAVANGTSVPTDAVDRVTIKEYLDSYNDVPETNVGKIDEEINTPVIDYENDIVGEGVDFNKEADKNILCVVNGLPLVHLKGHLSMHFDPYKMRFVYLSLEEVPESEFIAACEARGMLCDITNNEIKIRKEETQIVISPEGKVFIDDIPFSIDEQIKQDKNKKARKITKLEPCEDCISRQSVLNLFNGLGMYSWETSLLKRKIEKMSPVTPQQKIGQWTRELIRNEYGGCIGAKMICSECGQDNGYDKRMKFCPNCGSYNGGGRMNTIEFVKEVLEILRDMEDAYDVICNLDAEAVVERMEAEE